MAGCAVGYRGRTGKCHCDESGGLSKVTLMREDACASPNLDTNEVLLCGPCADAYDTRRESHGCAHCGAAMRQALQLPPLYENIGAVAELVPTLCPSCAVDKIASMSAAAASAAAEHTAAPLRAEVARLTDELALARAAVPQQRVTRGGYSIVSL